MELIDCAWITERLTNKVMVFDPEPMPKPVESYTKLKDDVYFSKIDLSKGVVKVKDRPIRICSMLSSTL
jgi:hypothetical protein